MLLPRLVRLAISRFGHRVSEPEIKLLLVVLFALGGLATQAGSEAVLPAYVAGLVVAGVFLHDRVLMDRLRSIAFALLTPFFFLRAGTLISAPALIAGAGVIAVLLLVKLAAKMIGVWPIAAAFKLPRRERTYTTLLMATGLTFGSIAALFGLTHGLIDQTQYTELVTVVILSAFVPTLIAQQLFRPACWTPRRRKHSAKRTSRSSTTGPRGPARRGPTWGGLTKGPPGPGRISSSSVQAMNLEQVADELYALAPAAFTAARDEQAGQARASGDAGLAGAIRKLRRPTVSAWLVNLLAREDGGQVDDLLELGQSLREAQRALDGDRLRELSAQRRRLVAALTQEAQRLAAQAGQAVSAQVEREVQDTLEAALADQGMADAVRSGRLTKALSYAGLGEGIGVSDAVAVWPAPAARPPRRAAGAVAARAERPGRRPRDGSETKEAARARREAEAAERARQEAEAAERNRQDAAEDAREAQAGLDEAEQEVTGAREKHQALQRQIDELERQLDQIQGESAQALRILRQAERLRDVAARALDGALRRLAKAEAKVSQHPD